MKIKMSRLLINLFFICFLIVVFKGTDSGSLPCYAYVTEIVAVMAVISIIGYQINKRAFVLTIDKWPILYVGVLLLYIVCGYLTFTYSKTATITFIYRYIILLPTMLFTINANDIERLFMWAEKYVLIIAACFCILYPINSVNGAFLGSYQNVGAALSIGLTLMLVDAFTKKSLQQWDIIKILLVMLTLFMTGKRTFALIPCAICLLFYINGAERKKRIRILRIITPIAIAIPVILYCRPNVLLIFERLLDSSGTISLTGREHYWALAKALWKQHMLHGIGIGTYSTYILNNRSLVYRWFGIQNVYSTHNIYYQILAEGGTIGFILWVSFFAVSIISTFRYLKNETEQHNAYVGVVSKAWAMQMWFVMYGFTGNPLTSMSNLYLFMFSVMTVQAVKREKEYDEM